MGGGFYRLKDPTNSIKVLPQLSCLLATGVKYSKKTEKQRDNDVTISCVAVCKILTFLV